MANMTSSVSASQVAGELASATFEEIPALVEHYREDPRQQVIKACERALKRHAKELAERERVNDMYELMHELGGDGVIVGVDEVGRGSVAGPLTVCAVCLPMEPRIWGINDSKKLTPARRELLSVKIAEVATAIGFCHIAPADIDDMGMARAIRAHRLMIAAQEHHAGLPLMRHDPLHHRGILMTAVRVVPQEDELILIRPELHSVPDFQETVERAMDIPHGQ